MADYAQSGNRWTAIYSVMTERGGSVTYRKLPFELVRFNVDTNPSATPVIVPCGEDVVSGVGATPNKPNSDKIYEKVWFVSGEYPWSQKTSFGPAE